VRHLQGFDRVGTEAPQLSGPFLTASIFNTFMTLFRKAEETNKEKSKRLIDVSYMASSCLTKGCFTRQSQKAERPWHNRASDHPIRLIHKSHKIKKLLADSLFSNPIRPRYCDDRVLTT